MLRECCKETLQLTIGYIISLALSCVVDTSLTLWSVEAKTKRSVDVGPGLNEVRSLVT